MKVLSVVFAALCVVVAVQAGCFKSKDKKEEPKTEEPKDDKTKTQPSVTEQPQQ